VQHSEFNHAQDATTHLLQIWILPSEPGIDPGYEQKQFDAADKRGRLRLVASPDGRDGSVAVHADASIRAGLFDAGEHAELALDPQRKAYVHLVRGQLSVNGQLLVGGDAAKLSGESRLVLSDAQDAEVLVFDLAA
jgi:redox-sensitive bicupin YhaK (pirin superfamily)